MRVKLISYSKPSRELVNDGLYDVKELIAYCAKVSNPSGQMNMASADKLLAYLQKHAHWSPFEMASACMEIETTRDIARQILRHRSFSFQEFSQRYADPTKDLDFVTREARLQDSSNRQNSIELTESPEDTYLQLQWKKAQQRVIIAAREEYNWAIQNGIAKEQARAVLPEGLTVSRMYMSGTIRSFIHYVQLRQANGTQKEHIEIAKAVAQAISEIFPAFSDFVDPGPT